jgi:hypothetical protein
MVESPRNSETNSDSSSTTSDHPEGGNEQAFLELGDVFKGVVENKDKNYERLFERYLEVHKLLMISYSCIRMTDDLLSQMDIHGSSITGLLCNLEYTRSEISEFIEEDCRDTETFE